MTVEPAATGERRLAEVVPLDVPSATQSAISIEPRLDEFQFINDNLEYGGISKTAIRDVTPKSGMSHIYYFTAKKGHDGDLEKTSSTCHLTLSDGKVYEVIDPNVKAVLGGQLGVSAEERIFLCKTARHGWVPFSGYFALRSKAARSESDEIVPEELYPAWGMKAGNDARYRRER